jgi:hypothetical protein
LTGDASLQAEAGFQLITQEENKLAQFSLGATMARLGVLQTQALCCESAPTYAISRRLRASFVPLIPPNVEPGGKAGSNPSANCGQTAL